MKRGAAVLLGLGGLLCEACGDSSDDPAEQGGSPDIVVDDATDVTAPAALLVGRLDVEQDCVVVESDEGTTLTVWPSGTRVSDSDPFVVILQDGEEIPIDGAEQSFVGGFAGSELADSACIERLDADTVWLMASDPLR